MTTMQISRIKETILQFSYECLLNCQHALNGYIQNKDKEVSLQFMSQAFQCIKPIQLFYLQNYEKGEIEQFESFFHQFGLLNIEFLESLETNHDMLNASIEMNNLEGIYSELKVYFSN